MPPPPLRHAADFDMPFRRVTLFTPPYFHYASLYFDAALSWLYDYAATTLFRRHALISRR